jgi:acyl-CoA synthetase (AMP-forming)/AMP-acid ligase II
VTLGELDLRSRAIAALLRRRHAQGERALLLYPAGIDFIAAFFGCLYAGIVAVPAYPPRSSHPERWAPRLAAIARNAEASIVLGTEEIVAMVSMVQREVPELARAHWVQTSSVPTSNAECWQEPSLDRETLALLQYTSGSTANPKGVMVKHGNLLHNLAYLNYLEENDDDSVSVSWLPQYHDMGLIEAVLLPIYSAYPAYLMSPVAFLQRPLRWLQAITRYRATSSGGPNFAFDLCSRKISRDELRGLDLSTWRVAYNGSEPIRWETLKRFHDLLRETGFKWSSFYPVYGLAESTLLVSGGMQAYQPRCLTLNAEHFAADMAVEAGGPEASTRQLTSCGPFSFETRVEIVRQDTGELCNPGEIGEIWIQGPSVAKGYWNRSEETQRCFHARLFNDGSGPFLRTGDLGFMVNGELVPAGRIKDLIIVRGRKHYPQDIEKTVEDCHKAIRAGYVAAFVLNQNEEERLVVVAEIDRHTLRISPDFNVVLAAVREAVAVIHDITLHGVALLSPGNIPRTSSGKIMRYACRSGLLEGTLQPVAHWVQSQDSDSEGKW